MFVGAHSQHSALVQYPGSVQHTGNDCFQPDYSECTILKDRDEPPGLCSLSPGFKKEKKKKTKTRKQTQGVKVRTGGVQAHIEQARRNGLALEAGPGEAHRPCARRPRIPLPPRGASSARCAKLAGHPPPRRPPGAGEASSTSASSRSLLSPQPVARSILLRSVSPSPTAEKGVGGGVSITLSLLPFPRDGDNGPLPPDTGGAPGSAPPLPASPFPSPPRGGARTAGGGREGAGPGAPPAPRPREEGGGYTPRC